MIIWTVRRLRAAAIDRGVDVFIGVWVEREAAIGVVGVRFPSRFPLLHVPHFTVDFLDRRFVLGDPFEAVLGARLDTEAT